MCENVPINAKICRFAILFALFGVYTSILNNYLILPIFALIKNSLPMKRLSFFVLLIFVSLTANAQFDKTHFDIGVSLGRGKDISHGTYETAAEKQFFEELEQLTTIDLSIGGFFKKGNSFGVEVFLDLGVGTGSMEDSSGKLVNGVQMEGTLGLMLNYRWIIDRNNFILGAGLASMASSIGTVYDDETHLLNGAGNGIPFKFKYEYKLSPHFGLGVSASAFLGAAGMITKVDNDVETEIEINENTSTGMSRWSVTFGPRLYF